MLFRGFNHGLCEVWSWTETEPFGDALAWWPDYSGERVFRVIEPKLEVSCVSRLGCLSLPGGFTANMAKPRAQATITAHQLNLVSDSIYLDHKGPFCKSFVFLRLGKRVSCLPPLLEEDAAPFASLHLVFLCSVIFGYMTYGVQKEGLFLPSSDGIKMTLWLSRRQCIYLSFQTSVHLGHGQ